MHRIYFNLARNFTQNKSAGYSCWENGREVWYLNLEIFGDYMASVFWMHEKLKKGKWENKIGKKNEQAK